MAKKKEINVAKNLEDVIKLKKVKKTKTKVKIISENNKYYNIVLSLDQSTSCTAWSLYDNKKLIDYGERKFKNSNLNVRINDIKYLLEELVDKFKPDIICFEDIQNQRSVVVYKALAELLGVLLDYCIEIKKPYDIIHTKTWASFFKIKGVKREEKKINTIDYIKEQFGIDVSDDIADAICIGKYKIENM